MTNKKSKNIAALFAAFFLIAPLFLANQTAFAGDPNCQSGYISNPYNNNPAPRRPSESQRKFAAAQTGNSQNQPPTNSGGTTTQFGFSFFASIFVLLGGIWAAFVLLRQRFNKLRGIIQVRPAKIRQLIFNPSFALFAFGLLFLATVIGGVLTKPSAVTAEKRQKPNKSLMTGAVNPSNKPVFKTSQQIGGNGTTQIGTPVFDAAGNRYISGGFTGNLTIGATTLIASKDFDLFIAKYDANGNALWARQATGATGGVPETQAIEGATALSVDGGGNVYVGGSFVKTLVLQGGANQNITLNDNGAAGINYESFVAKYDANGNLLWAKGGNSNSPKNAANLETGQNGIDEIVFDTNGNPYVAGFVSGDHFLGSAFTNQGQSDIMLARLNPANGAIAWKQIIGGTKDDNGLNLKIDAANNLYLVGNFASPSITFPSGDTFTNPLDPNDSEGVSTDTFIAKFDTGGSNLWTEDIGGASDVGVSQIAVNDAGEIFMTGYFFDSVNFGGITLFETEGTGETDEASLGGYIAKMDVNGDFVWAKEFGGVGASLALDGADEFMLPARFTTAAHSARAKRTKNLWQVSAALICSPPAIRQTVISTLPKPLPARARKAESPSAILRRKNRKTENNYNPLGLAYNPAHGTMFVSGDFQTVVALDCQTLKIVGGIRHSYLAELSADGETTSCRIWNGLDADDNNWDSTDNWNSGVVPGDYDSVYVPYTGNNYDAPTYNPAGFGSILTNLTVAADRTLTTERDLVITGKLWLIGGFINTGADRLLDLTDTATADRITDADGGGGYVVGRLRKDFGSSLAPFVFPVGTASGYSPVDVYPQSGFGASLSVKAVEQPQPSFANSANRINRYWNLNQAGEGFLTANLKFHYLQTDVVGSESALKLFKIEPPDPPEMQTAAIDAAANTAAVNNVSQFSDWTLASFAPTAARVSVGGRVTAAHGRAIAQVLVKITDTNGNVRTTTTNSFGFYRFGDVPAGNTYIIEARHKRYKFSNPAQVRTILADQADINFSTLD